MIPRPATCASPGLTPFGKGFFVFDPATETGSIDDFVDTVSRSALGTSNPVYTRQLAEHSLDRAKELEDWGYFDQTLANRPFMWPIEDRAIPLMERVVITHLLKEDGRITYVDELRDHHAPMLRAANMHELRLAWETRNMILSAEMKLRASLMRTESRCSHYRLDYPEIDEENWRAWINIYHGEDGSMQLEKQPFGSWPE
ncbi:MAG: hypothetical protein R3E44_12135 [Paracoccaceae bacterium]